MDQGAVHHEGGRQSVIVSSGAEQLAHADRNCPAPPHIPSVIQLNGHVHSARSAPVFSELQGVDRDALNQAIPDLRKRCSLVEQVDADDLRAKREGDLRTKKSPK